MSVFSKILHSIFGKAEAAEKTEAPASSEAGKTPSSSGPASGDTAAGKTPTGGGAQVDVSAVLTRLAAEKKEKLDWKHSIVDLMKVLDLDSSFSARKELAQELKFPGDMGDSAAMNIWLHKQVMQKLAENGGKVPDDLKS